MKSARFALLVCLLFPSLAPVAAAQTDAASRARRVERGLLPPVLVKGVPAWSIEERMRHYNVPAVSVAVVKDFKVEWARAYGVKDAETKEPATEKTLFQAGSISKPVAAMAALKQVELGKLSLDSDINERLTSWKIPANEFTAKKKVTLANLLSHTAGLTVHGFPGYAPGEKIPTVPEILDGGGPANTAPVRVDLEPGTKFRYSGGGTTVMQLALTDTLRKPFPVIAKETVLAPLGMKDSTYEQPLPADWLKRAASGHRAGGFPVEGKLHVYPEMAAAGLWTTPTDLATFGIEVQLSLQGKSNKVLSKAMTERMVTPFIEGSPGLGFFPEKRGASSFYFGHNGADEGFRAMLLMHRDKGYGVAVMVNSDNGQIMGEVIRAVAAEYGWDEYLPPALDPVSLSAEKLSAFAGRYLVNPDRVLTVTVEQGRLYAQPTQSPKVELIPVSENSFVRTDADLRYTFEPAADGQPPRVAILQGGQTLNAPRTGDAPLIPLELLLAGKTDEALAAYRKLKQEQPAHAVVSESRLNTLGYDLLRQKKLRESVAIFSLNAELYPQSFNVYDSLGDAYAESGEKELAIKNYRRSVELNPANKEGAEKLKKLEAKP
ncbi:MAG TPA: serine hydrolase [Pyrinomonadaceae bacterium]|jgi:CubicO group peptidase (beta-lactamase class C family)|nr:serine hydrolase [Pyrinomonadaceae bacterium]